ncbi:MAG: hypothetical protein KGL43_02185 [Burkholderiales bacterium]|nr:hypothetical protein [Burkholderiales bacterium]MDE2395801.1 hypothetical protein [Burkholderiales bacterium]MDE2452378.1 hypothetical protein [Burkholderiales bacterium]
MKRQHDPRIKVAIDNGASRVNLETLGVSRFDWRDPYHVALTLSWPAFFALLIGAYGLVNILFALCYFEVPGCIANLPPRQFADAFFFSVETLATVGYGVMAPATLYGHWVATFEIFVGMLFTATTTGLVFVRFSKPKAKILFADHAVVSRHGSRPILMLRVGNGRANPLSDAQARLTVLVVDEGPEGQSFRRAVELKLVMPLLPLFAQTWTVMHELDASSPLRDLLLGPAAPEGLRMMLSISARDPALGAEVHATRAYRGADVAIGMRYVDAVHWDGGNRTVADMRLLGAIEAEA